MRQVRQLPPNDFFKIEVSLESRQGMYCSFPLFAVSSSDMITFLKKNKDLLISIASLLNLPTGLNILSDPAKSTKNALLTLQFPIQSLSSIVTIKIECDLEEQSWILLQATTLFLLPMFQALIISSPLWHYFSLRSSMMNSRSIYHRMRKPLSILKSELNMSLIFQLQIWMNEHFMTADEVLCAQISEIAAKIIPQFWESPSKAKVFPEPVWPYVRIAVLQPSMNLPMSECTWQFLYMLYLVVAASWIISTCTCFTSSPGILMMSQLPYLLTETMLVDCEEGLIFIPTLIDAFFIIFYYGVITGNKIGVMVVRGIKMDHRWVRMGSREAVVSQIFKLIRELNSSIRRKFAYICYG